MKPVKVRDIYQSAIEAQPPHELSDEDCKSMFLRFAALEKNLGEIDRARAIYTQASYLADPSKDKSPQSLCENLKLASGHSGMNGMDLKFVMEMKIPSERCAALRDLWQPASANSTSILPP